MAHLEPSAVIGMKCRLKRRLYRKPFAADSYSGYPVYRGWDFEKGARQILEEFKPTVIVTQCGRQTTLANIWLNLGVPVLIYLRDVVFEEFDDSVLVKNGVRFVANSRFTGERAWEKFGITADIIPPIVHPERYRVQSDRSHVVFINPHPFKGVDLALDIARRVPDIPFLFVEGWALDPKWKGELRRAISKLTNVRLVKRVNDMRQYYSRARVVIAPSQCEEAWGRIATEAQSSGIPVIASNIGGLPESVGEGGVLLPPTGQVEQWCDVLRRVFGDELYYRDLVQQTYDYATRPDIQPDVLFQNFQTSIERVEAHLEIIGRRQRSA